MRLPVLWRDSLPPILAPGPAPQTDDLPAAAPDFNGRPENIYGRMEFHPLSWPLECGLEQTFSVICTFTASPPPSHTSPLSFLRHWRWANISLPPFSLSPIFLLSYVFFLSPFLSLFFTAVYPVLSISISLSRLKSSAPDPWHFQMDPDPWIRILDYGSKSGTGSGSGFFSFWQWLSRCQQKIRFFKDIFAYFFLVGTLTSVFKDNNMSLRIHIQ